MNIKKTIVALAIAMAVAFVASVGMASAATLYADQDIPVGTVTVSADGTTITYATTGGWVLNATHLHVASEVDDIPQTKKKNPIPGLFDYSAVHDPPVTVYTYTIPAEPACTLLYIAAQAEVSLLEEGVYVQEESAWAGIAEGDIPFEGKNWATYFTYEIPPEILHLDNKDPITWQPITGDGISGILEYCPSGPTFDFVFDGQGLDPSADYSLIYYADPWPGDNPGALIDSGKSDVAGNIHLAGSTELGMDLPHLDDANYPGAKIWLVLSGDYSVTETKMTGWNPTKYLYEHNLITYDDTDV
jgi:hypothetical protein